MMTIDEMIVVLQAVKDGKTVQCWSSGLKTWRDIETPAWDFTSIRYRIKPESKIPREWYATVITESNVILAHPDDDFVLPVATKGIFKVREVLD